MSISALAASVLSKFLGDYVDGIDQKNLEISCLQGTATLTNLTIKKSVLESLSYLPIQIKEGFLGKVDLRIPWSTLSSESAVIRLSDIYLLLQSGEEEPLTEAELAEIKFTSKMHQLQLASVMGLDKPEATPEEVAEGLNKESSGEGYFEGLALKVINNIQIFIDNIHIRYEDSISNPKEPFCLGLMLESIHMQSTDANWQPNFIVLRDSILHKILSLNKFSLYFDTNPQLMRYQGKIDFANQMKSYIYKSEQATVSGYVKATVQQGRPDFALPVLDIELAIEEINGSLTEKQYARTTDLMRWITVAANREKYITSIPPSMSPIQDPIAWWQFATKTVYKNDVTRASSQWSWAQIKQNAEFRIKYIELYAVYVTIGPDKMSKSDRDELERMERLTSYECLLSWRKLANALKMEKEKKQKALAEKRSNQSWASRWFGASSVDEVEEETALADLYEKIGFEKESATSSASNTPSPTAQIFPVDYIHTKISVKLKKMEFKLIGAHKETLASAEIHLLSCDVAIFPANDMKRIHMKMGTFSVCDYTTMEANEPWYFLEMQKDAPSRIEDMKSQMEVVLDINRPDIIAQYSIEIRAQPISFTFSKPLAKRLNKFFTNKEMQDKLGEVAGQSLDVIKKKVEAQLQYSLEDRPKVALTFKMQSGTFIIPYDPKDRKAPCLVVNTGHLTLASDLSPKEIIVNSESDVATRVDQFYDSFKVSLSYFQVHTQHQYNNDWKVLPSEYILFPVVLEVGAKFRRYPITSIPSVIIDGNIDAIKLQFTTPALIDIITIGKTFSTPASQAQIEAGQIQQTVEQGLEVTLEKESEQIEQSEGGVLAAKKILEGWRDTAAESEYAKTIGYKLSTERKSLAELKFNIQSFKLSVGHGSNHENVDSLLEIGFDNLNSALSINDDKINITGQIGDIFVRSMVPFQGQKEGDNHIVSCVGDIRGNNEKGHFLDLAYTWVDMNSDLFGKKKEQNRIDVDLYQVIVKLRRELLLQLVAKFQEIQKSIMPLLSEMTNEPPLIEPQPKLEEARLSRASTGTLTKVTAKDGKARSPVKRPLQPIPKEKDIFKKMHLYFHANKIQLIVSAHSNERPFFDAFFSEMMTNVSIFSDDSISNQGHVLGFELIGFSSKKWNKLISIVQQESPKNKLIPLEGVLEEQSKAKLILFDFALRPDGTAVVDLNTGPIQYVHNQKFLSSLMELGQEIASVVQSNLPSQDTSNLKDIVKEEPSSIPQESKSMKPILKVSIGSLRFVLPNYENEDEYISLGVGAIDVSTKGDKESLTYLLNVETLNIIAMRDHREKHILNDISFQCVAELFRDDLNMDASIQRIHFHLDLVSIEFILLIARALVADLPKIKPEIAKKAIQAETPQVSGKEVTPVKQQPAIPSAKSPRIGFKFQLNEFSINLIYSVRNDTFSFHIDTITVMGNRSSDLSYANQMQLTEKTNITPLSEGEMIQSVIVGISNVSIDIPSIKVTSRITDTKVCLISKSNQTIVEANMGRFSALVSQHAFLDCMGSEGNNFLFAHFDSTTESPVMKEDFKSLINQRDNIIVRLGDIKLDIQRKPIYYSLLELNGILLFVAQIIPQLPQLPQETKAGYEEIRQILAEEEAKKQQQLQRKTHQSIDLLLNSIGLSIFKNELSFLLSKININLDTIGDEMKVKGNIASFSQLQSPTWPQIILTKDSQFLDFMYHQEKSKTSIALELIAMTYIHNQTLLQTIINYFMQLATTLDDELVKIQNTINLINGEIPSKEVAAANQKVVVPASDTLMLINATIHNQTVILPKDANNPFQDCLVFEIGRIQCDSNPRNSREVKYAVSLDGLNLSTRRKIESDGATHLEEKKILKNLQKMILHVDLTKPAPQDKEKKEKLSTSQMKFFTSILKDFQNPKGVIDYNEDGFQAIREDQLRKKLFDEHLQSTKEAESQSQQVVEEMAENIKENIKENIQQMQSQAPVVDRLIQVKTVLNEFSFSFLNHLENENKLLQFKCEKMGVEASIDTNNTNVNYHLKDLLITDSLESLDNAIMTHLAVITPDNPNDSAISGTFQSKDNVTLIDTSILNIIVTPKAKTINYFLSLQKEILSQLQPDEEKKKENGERKKENGERKKENGERKSVSPVQSPRRSSSQALQEKKVQSRMEVNVIVKQIIAELKKNHLPIASFNIVKTSLALTQRDEAQRAQFSVGQITLEDKRPSKEYTNLFELKYPTTVDYELNPSTHSTNIGIELLSPKFVLVPKALTEIYSVVQEFLPPPDQNKEDAQENGKKLTTNGDAERKVEQNQLVLPVHSNGDKANTPHSTQQDSILKVKINIRNSFQIHFLKLLAKNEGESLFFKMNEINLDFASVGSKRNIKLNLTHLMMSRDILNSVTQQSWNRINSTFLIKPFDIAIILNHNEERQSDNIAVHFGRLDIIISYHDLLLVQGLYFQMNPLIDALQGVIKSDAAEEQPLGDQRLKHVPLVLDDDYYEHVEKQVSEEICLIDESSEAEFSESEKGPSLANHEESPQKIDRSVVIQLESINLSLLDDSKYSTYTIPICKLEIIQLKLVTIFSNSLDPQSSKIELYGELEQLQMSSFNSIFSTWEPLIEPTIAKVNLEKRTKRTNIHLELGELVNINLTKEVLNAVLNASELYTKLNDEFNRPKADNTVRAIETELQQKKNVEIKMPKQQQIFERELKARDPFVLKNQTGKMIALWFDDERSGVIELKDNQEISLSNFISKNKKGDISRDDVASMKNAMSFKLINSPSDREIYDLPVNDVRFDVVGYNTYRISSKDPSTLVAVAISLDSGSKFIHLHSIHAFQNNTDFKLELGLIDNKSNKAVTTVVAPNELYCVPIGVKFESLKFRPIEVMTKSFLSEGAQVVSRKSSHSIIPKKHKKGEDKSLAEKNTVLFAWGNERKLQSHLSGLVVCEGDLGIKWAASLMSHPVDNTLMVAPPFAVENLLPYPLLFLVSLFEKETKQIEIAPGKEESMYFLNKKEHLYFTIKLNGFKESKEIKLFSLKDEAEGRKGAKKRKESVVLHSEGEAKVNTLTLTLDYVYDSHSMSTKVKILTRYWISNISGLPLQFSLSNENFMLPMVTTPYHDAHKDEIVYEKILKKTDPRLWYEATQLRGSFVEEDKENDEIYYSGKSAPRVLCGEERGITLRFASPNSSFTQPIDLGVSNEGRIIFEEKSTGQTFMFYMSIVPAPGKFLLTSLVRIRPGTVLVNQTGLLLRYKQASQADVINIDDSFILEDNEQIPFHWPSTFNPYSLLISLRDQQGDIDTDWSTGINIDNISNFQIRLQNKMRKSHLGLNVNIRLINGTIFVIFYFDMIPYYRISNHSSSDIEIRQGDAEGAIQIVRAGITAPFFWKEPQVPNKFIYICPRGQKGKLRKISLDELKSHRHLTISQELALSIQVKVDGPTKSLELNDVFEDDLILTTTASAAKKATSREVDMSVTIAMRGIGVSCIDNTPKALLYITLQTISCLFETSNVDQRIEFKMGSLQVDNQLSITPFPVLLFNKAPRDKDFVHLTLIRDLQYQTAIQIQEFDIEMESNFLLQTLLFVDDINRHLDKRNGIDKEVALLKGKQDRMLYLSQTSLNRSSMFYFEILQLNPIRFNVSFLTIPKDEKIEYQNYAFLDALLEYLQFFTEVDSAPIQLNGIVLENSFASKDEMMAIITTHYQYALFSQVYKIAFSFNFLGSPVNFVSTLGTGVYDFFHEPLAGIVKSPQDFGAGVVKGSKSLVKNSVFAIFDSVSKITDSFSRVGVAISDDEYIKARSRMQQYKAKHIGEGLLLGARDFGVGIYQGITGVVTAPIEGAQKEGFLGFVKGIGFGVTGVVVKPLIGTVDLVTRTAEGIKNTTKLGDDNRMRIRIRPPRHFGSDRILTIYDVNKAVGQEMLHRVDGGKYSHDVFLYKTELIEDDVLFVTNQFILIASKPNAIQQTFGEQWKTVWRVAKNVIRLKVNKNILTLVMDSDFKGAEKHKDCQLLDDALEKARKIAYFIRPSKPVQIDVVDRVQPPKLPTTKHPLTPPNTKALAKEPKSGGASLSPSTSKNGNGDQRIEFELNQDQMRAKEDNKHNTENDRLIVNDEEEKERGGSCFNCGGKDEGCVII